MPTRKKRIDGYVILRLADAGGHGVLWKGRNEKTSEDVAVRMVDRRPPLRDDIQARLKVEIKVLRQITHPNVVRLLDMKKTALHVYLVLEHCGGGDLVQFLRKRGRLPEDSARSFLGQLARGLCAVHVAGTFHGDLQPCNILLAGSPGQPIPKIANIACRGVPSPYAAPEVLRDEAHGPGSDIWSLGVLLCELILGRRPFAGASESRLLASIDTTSPCIAKLGGALVSFSDEAQEFLELVLQENPSLRPTSRELVWHPYVKNVHLRHQPGAHGSRAKLYSYPGKARLHWVFTMSKTRASARLVQPTVVSGVNKTDAYTGYSLPRCGGGIELSHWHQSRAACAVHSVARSLRLLGLDALAAKYGRGVLDRPNAVVQVVVGQGLLHSLWRREPSFMGFVMGQFRRSHMFRFFTSRMFPRVLCVGWGLSSSQTLTRWNVLAAVLP
mmetsp:Transcript_17414/g.47551  ORF Transcript_17414/g.47551 Transcript_17414/m.47551 type:complete len:442 (+) Transcript_17414:78-1403(+)